MNSTPSECLLSLNWCRVYVNEKDIAIWLPLMMMVVETYMEKY